MNNTNAVTLTLASVGRGGLPEGQGPTDDHLRDLIVSMIRAAILELRLLTLPDALATSGRMRRSGVQATPVRLRDGDPTAHDLADLVHNLPVMLEAGGTVPLRVRGLGRPAPPRLPRAGLGRSAGCRARHPDGPAARAAAVTRVQPGIGNGNAEGGQQITNRSQRSGCSRRRVDQPAESMRCTSRLAHSTASDTESRTASPSAASS